MGAPSLMMGLLDSTPRIPLPISMIGAFLCTNPLCSLPFSRGFTATIFETKHPRPRLRAFDKIFWVSAACAIYREDQWQRRSKHTELES